MTVDSYFDQGKEGTKVQLDQTKMEGGVGVLSWSGTRAQSKSGVWFVWWYEFMVLQYYFVLGSGVGIWG